MTTNNKDINGNDIVPVAYLCMACQRAIPPGDEVPTEFGQSTEHVHNEIECMNRASEILERRYALQRKVDAAMETLIQEVNGGSSEALAGAITDHLRRTHRTLQAGFMRALKSTIEQYAGFDTDLRNEDAVEWAGTVAKAGEKSYMRFI